MKKPKSPRDIGLPQYSSWTEYAVPTELTCCGCASLFTVDPEDFRATPDLDPELIYCDVCNEEARLWVERVEANW